jgi:hypothetical protein
MALDVHDELLGREAPAGRERLELQPVRPPALLTPRPQRRVAQAHRTTQVELAVGVQPLDLGLELEPGRR